MLGYTLQMSSKYYPSRSECNTFAALTTDDGNCGAGTKSATGAYINAYLGGYQHVSHVEVKGCAPNMYGGFWNAGGCNQYPCIVQYRNTSGSWVTLRDFRTSKMPSNHITSLPIQTSTDCVRVYTSSGYASCGTLRVFGHGGHYYGHYHGSMIPYSLAMSSKYTSHPTYVKNTYSHLISDDENKAAATNYAKGQYIQASLGTYRHVTRIEVKCGASPVFGYPSYAKCQVQYLDATSGQWVTLRDFTSTAMPKDYITAIPLGASTNAIRLYNAATTYIVAGTLRVFG